MRLFQSLTFCKSPPSALIFIKSSQLSVITITITISADRTEHQVCVPVVEVEVARSALTTCWSLSPATAPGRSTTTTRGDWGGLASRNLSPRTASLPARGSPSWETSPTPRCLSWLLWLQPSLVSGGGGGRGAGGETNNYKYFQSVRVQHVVMVLMILLIWTKRSKDLQQISLMIFLMIMQWTKQKEKSLLVSWRRK